MQAGHGLLLLFPCHWPHCPHSPCSICWCLLPACSPDAGCPGSGPAGGPQQANCGGAAAGEPALCAAGEQLQASPARLPVPPPAGLPLPATAPAHLPNVPFSAPALPAPFLPFGLPPCSWMASWRTCCAAASRGGSWLSSTSTSTTSAPGTSVRGRRCRAWLVWHAGPAASAAAAAIGAVAGAGCYHRGALPSHTHMPPNRPSPRFHHCDHARRHRVHPAAPRGCRRLCGLPLQAGKWGARRARLLGE